MIKSGKMKIDQKRTMFLVNIGIKSKTHPDYSWDTGRCIIAAATTTTKNAEGRNSQWSPIQSVPQYYLSKESKKTRNI